VILYSIIPVGVVFDSQYNCEKFNFMEIEYEGEKVVVSPLSNSTYRVDRLISTSPKAYLNPKLMPGQIIESLV
jgi:hypothetical protein